MNFLATYLSWEAYISFMGALSVTGVYTLVGACRTESKQVTQSITNCHANYTCQPGLAKGYPQWEL